MSLPDTDVLIRILREPELLGRCTPSQYDLLLRQGRRAELLGRVALLVDELGLDAEVPQGFASNLDGIRVKLQAHREGVWRELVHIQAALAPLGVPVVLLKGAAYMADDLPAARGRLFSDVDIMVPQADLTAVEKALLLHGWVPTNDSAYDQHYYRTWMHELPPLVHVRRATTIDVHHTISAPTSRWHVDGGPLLSRARDLNAVPGLKCLDLPDMILHSMVHLLLNEELSHGLRDLSDIDLLLRHGSAQGPSFWPDLLARAQVLNLMPAPNPPQCGRLGGAAIALGLVPAGHLAAHAATDVGAPPGHQEPGAAPQEDRGHALARLSRALARPASPVRLPLFSSRP